MSKSHRSSHASEICRIEWRASRLLATLLMLLGVLGAFAALASEMPRGAAWPLALAAVVHGIAEAQRLVLRPSVSMVWDGHAAVVAIDGMAVDAAELQWRGPLAFLRYRDASGDLRRLAWWPDTLDARQRRELRLAAGPLPASRSPASMAP